MKFFKGLSLIVCMFFASCDDPIVMLKGLMTGGLIYLFPRMIYFIIEEMKAEYKEYQEFLEYKERKYYMQEKVRR